MVQNASKDLKGKASSSEEKGRRRRERWTKDQDTILKEHIGRNGVGRWKTVAENLRRLGLNKTGQSCRYRWFQYLAPGIQGGSITDKEMLSIIELRYKWGNKWSKIAKHLPGRTDNDIKNCWNSRIKKEAKEVKCDVKSKEFVEIIRINLSKGNQAESGLGGIDGGSTVTASGGSGGMAVEGSTAIVDHPDEGSAVFGSLYFPLKLEILMNLFGCLVTIFEN